jgi:MFS family permease
MAGMVLANIASEMYLPLLPLYLKDLNASVLQVGLFFTLSRIIPLALQILGGWVSDTLGRLRSVAIGSLFGVVSYIGLILAPTWQWVLLADALSSMTRALVGPSFGAFIAEQSSEQNRARVYGITETIFMLVAVIGPPLGGWLAGAYGFKVMLGAAAILYTAATLIRVIMARRAAVSGQAAPSERLSLSGLRANLGAILALLLSGGVMSWILLTDGVRDVAFSLSFSLESIYLEEIGGLSLAQIGLLGSIFGIATMLINIPAGWLADKKGERGTIVIGFLLHFAGLLIFLNVNTFWGYAAAWATFGLGVGFMGPAYQSLTSKAVPEKVRGTAFGLINSSLGLVSLPAPAVGAQLWERFSPQFPFQITALAALLTVLPVWFKFKLPAQNEEAAAPAGGSPAPALESSAPAAD